MKKAGTANGSTADRKPVQAARSCSSRFEGNQPLRVEESITPSLFNVASPSESKSIIRQRQYEKGIVRLSSTHFSYENSHDLPTEARDGGLDFGWTGMEELRTEHAYGVAVEILDPAGLWLFTKQSHEARVRAIKGQVAKELWPLVERELIVPNPDDDGPFVDPALAAIWVELNEERLSDLWLAAMAMHAMDSGNLLACGYLIGLIDHRHNAQREYLRGKDNAKNTSSGGIERAKKERETSGKIFAAMKSYIDQGETSTTAASRTYKENGLGKSPSANLRRWQRYQKHV